MKRKMVKYHGREVAKAKEEQMYKDIALDFGDFIKNAMLLAVHNEFNFGADRLYKLTDAFNVVIEEVAHDTGADARYGQMKLQREVNQILGRKKPPMDCNPVGDR